jgi:hypothetical protein
MMGTEGIAMLHFLSRLKKILLYHLPTGRGLIEYAVATAVTFEDKVDLKYF